MTKFIFEYSRDALRPKKKYCLFPISDRPYQNMCDPNLFYRTPPPPPKKKQHISVFQDLKHILLLTTGYTGANKNRMSTVVDISVLRVKHRMSTVVDISVLRVKHRMSTEVNISVLRVKTQNVYCSRHQCPKG